MRRTGRYLALLVALAAVGRSADVALLAGGHCHGSAPGHNVGDTHHATGPSAATELNAAAGCEHCPISRCAASSRCGAGSASQLAASSQSPVTVPETHQAAVPAIASLRSTSSSPPTPPPQPIA